METNDSWTPARQHSTVDRGWAPESSVARDAPCDLVTVPLRQGLEAVDILRRGAQPASFPAEAAEQPAAAGSGGVGPVLHDDSCDTLGFLVPAGTAADWDLPGSSCTQTFGRGLRTAAAETEEPPIVGADWLVPPADAAAVTDPAMLRSALGEAARLIEAADRCC